jgi:hypothetical protein
MIAVIVVMTMITSMIITTAFVIILALFQPLIDPYLTLITRSTFWTP